MFGNKIFYTSHPYKRDVIGTLKLFHRLLEKILIITIESFIPPKNMTTIVVGDFNHEEVLNTL